MYFQLETSKQRNKQTNKQTATNRFKPTLKLVKFRGESWSDWLLPRVIWLQESLGGLQLGPPSCVSNTTAFPAYLYMLSQIGIVYCIICLQTIIVQLPSPQLAWHQKIGGWKMHFLLGWPIFTGMKLNRKNHQKFPVCGSRSEGVCVCVCVHTQHTKTHIRYYIIRISSFYDLDILWISIHMQIHRQIYDI